MRYLFLPSPHVGVFVLSHNAYKVARRPLPFYSPAIPFKTKPILLDGIQEKFEQVPNTRNP